jgi:hypothetical protein
VASAEPTGKASSRARALRDWAAALFLFLATAAVVIWQNSRLAVLWDLSYILENSYRIALGQLPYRDFPFPYAPGTFLVQALLIRLTGRVFFHHILYCAIVGGAGTLLAWRILLHILRHSLASFRLVAFLLALPLTVLGIYCVFPHPFYDPDCTLVILFCVLLLLHLEHKEFPVTFAFFTGVACVVPVFAKQNTGIAFLGMVGLAAIVLTVFEFRGRGRRIKGLASLASGMIVGLGAAILLIHVTVSLQNYAHWTIRFAAARRLPRVAEMWAPFENPLLLLWIAAFGAGAFLLRYNPAAKAWLRMLSAVLMAAPFAWTVLYLFLETDTSERAERLLSLWPLLLVVSFVLATRSLIRGPSMVSLLPFILIGTVAGAFLSQQLWGSTYAIWPFLMILFACVLTELHTLAVERTGRELEWLAAVAAVCVFVAGGFYVASHERLDYADVSGGEIARSGLPALAGLATRGPWIPEFEELVRFSDRAIPKNEGLLMIPGEDLFYYTTGRQPQFPVLMFDHTVNPYSPEEIVELARKRNICWLVVKKNLQLNGEPVEDKDRLLALLRTEFAPFQGLANYEIFRKPGCADGSK